MVEKDAAEFIRFTKSQSSAALRTYAAAWKGESSFLLGADRRVEASELSEFFRLTRKNT